MLRLIQFHLQMQDSREYIANNPLSNPNQYNSLACCIFGGPAYLHVMHVMSCRSSCEGFVRECECARKCPGADAFWGAV